MAEMRGTQSTQDELSVLSHTIELLHQIPLLTSNLKGIFLNNGRKIPVTLLTRKLPWIKVKYPVGLSERKTSNLDRFKFQVRKTGFGLIIFCCCLNFL